MMNHHQLLMIITFRSDVIIINLSSEPVMMIMVLVSPGSFPPRAFDDNLMIMMIMIMIMMTIGHLSFLLRSDQGVLLLVLVQNRDLVIQDFVVHPNNRGNQPEYFILFSTLDI